MNCVYRAGRLLALASILLGAGSAWAQWDLDSTKSAVNFVSIKNDSVAEVHSFTSLNGYIGKDGNLQLAIALDSVETLVPIRNERMREMLFETVEFPSATITGRLDPVILTELARGGTLVTDLPLTLSLHGQDKTLEVPVVAVGTGNGALQVFTARPVIINAADFGLEQGVAALQQVVNLKAISTAVPVTVHLAFAPPAAAPAGEKQ